MQEDLLDDLSFENLTFGANDNDEQPGHKANKLKEELNSDEENNDEKDDENDDGEEEVIDTPEIMPNSLPPTTYNQWHYKKWQDRNLANLQNQQNTLSKSDTSVPTWSGKSQAHFKPYGNKPPEKPQKSASLLTKELKS